MTEDFDVKLVESTVRYTPARNTNRIPGWATMKRHTGSSLQILMHSGAGLHRIWTGCIHGMQSKNGIIPMPNGS